MLRDFFNFYQAKQILKQGGVLAYPTEAVYGLGCDPTNKAAVLRLLALKKRSPDKGLILIAANFSQLRPWLDSLAPEQLERILPTWPGPVTWLVPKAAKVPAYISGTHDSLAVRVTNHPLVAKLCQAFGGPIVSTSANPEGQPPAKTAPEVQAYFGESLDFILAGSLGNLAKPTEIRDVRTGAIVRAG